MNTNAVDEKCFLDAFGEYLDTDLRNNDWNDFKHVTEANIAVEIFEFVKGREPDQRELTELNDCFVQKLKAELIKDSTQFAEIAGALDFFASLRTSQQHHVGIATGSWSSSARVKLDAIGLEYSDIPFAHSDAYITREDITMDAIQQSRNKYQVDFDEIVYFGDGIWDYKTCMNVGIRFIGIDCNSNGKLTQLGATHVFQNYLNSNSILSAIENINR
jgi:phosphoglycolate phosphatase-like HAD superfamily hydrolase